MKEFRYKCSITQLLHDNGVTLGSDSPIGQASLTAFRKGRMTGFASLQKVCTLCNCSLDDLIETIDVPDAVVDSDAVPTNRDGSVDRRSKQYKASKNK